MEKPKKWTHFTYEILQFVPTNAYQAVFAEALEDGWTFDIRELAGVAVVKVTDVHMVCSGHDKDGRAVNPREYDRTTTNDIAGVYFNSSDCGFRVCDEHNNYVGLISRGEQPSFEPPVGVYALDDRYYPEEKFRPRPDAGRN